MADERSASMLELKTVDVPRGHYDVATLERWEQDGLYAQEAISLIQVREMLPGIAEMDLEASGMVAAA